MNYLDTHKLEEDLVLEDKQIRNLREDQFRYEGARAVLQALEEMIYVLTVSYTHLTLPTTPYV